MGKILVCGALGYIGQRLVTRLVDEGNARVRLLIRDARLVPEKLLQQVDVIEGDLLDQRVLMRAAEGIDVAYYPVRFIGMGKGFEEMSLTFSERFREACIDSGVRRIVYFGIHGGSDSRSTLVRSMVKTGDILSAHPEKIQTVWLKAGSIVSAGSVLFDMLKSLIMKAPVILVPRWMLTKIQPNSIADVVELLTRARELDVAGNIVIDLTSGEVSLEDMLKVTADVLGVKRSFVRIPASLPRVSSLFLMLFTPLSYGLASTIVQALSPADSESVSTPGLPPECFFPHFSATPLRRIIEVAIQDIEHELVASRWTDNLTWLSYTFSEDEVVRAVFRDVKTVDFGDLPAGKVFRSVKSIGGKRGWFTFDLLWQIRGVMDKLMGGFGTSVGRRVEIDLRIGDMLDVWRVVDLVDGKRILLEAQMVVFGKAWLEFRIDGRTLTQTAYHLPSGILGRLYWYSMLPFHAFIFKDMIESIVKRARQLE